MAPTRKSARKSLSFEEEEGDDKSQPKEMEPTRKSARKSLSFEEEGDEKSQPKETPSRRNSDSSSSSKSLRNEAKESDKESRPKREPMLNFKVGNVPYKSTMKVETEIRHLKNSTRLLIPKLAFQRLVREVMLDLRPNFLIQASALEALQEAAESKLTQDLEDAYAITNNAKRVTLLPRDFNCMQKIKQDM